MNVPISGAAIIEAFQASVSVANQPFEQLFR